jgi:acyl-coenzyme A thioesterase PaaI-like protein
MMHGTAPEKAIMQLDPLPFAKLMGVTVVSVTPDLVVGELKVREDLARGRTCCTAGLHGLRRHDRRGRDRCQSERRREPHTIESKTNFFAAIPLGDTARAECTRLHKGRSTMVWQTKITRGDGTALRGGDADADGAEGESVARMERSAMRAPDFAALHRATSTSAPPQRARSSSETSRTRRRPADRKQHAAISVVQISFLPIPSSVGAPGS